MFYLGFHGLFGALGAIRTPDFLLRSEILYPAELQAHAFSLNNR
jgi:hypothetical protein